MTEPIHPLIRGPDQIRTVCKNSQMKGVAYGPDVGVLIAAARAYADYLDRAADPSPAAPSMSFEIIVNPALPPGAVKIIGGNGQILASFRMDERHQISGITPESACDSPRCVKACHPLSSTQQEDTADGEADFRRFDTDSRRCRCQ